MVRSHSYLCGLLLTSPRDQRFYCHDDGEPVGPGIAIPPLLQAFD